MAEVQDPQIRLRAALVAVLAILLLLSLAIASPAGATSRRQPRPDLGRSAAALPRLASAVETAAVRALDDLTVAHASTAATSSSEADSSAAGSVVGRSTSRGAAAPSAVGPGALSESAVNSAPPTPAPTGQFFVDPYGEANTEESQLLASGQTTQAAALDQIASQGQGIWLNGPDSLANVPSDMTAAARQGTIPVFVLYDIPWRDCGGDSSGGASDPAAYDSFVDEVAADLGQGRAYVIVEPDALAEMSCLTSSQQQSYYQMIGYAARQIDNDANASVYVDAGNPTWQTAAAAAAALQQALGSTRAGFSLNVSNYVSTADNITYGTAISQATGGRHFVIDTSRNGASVPYGQWCDVQGAALGSDPTTDTGNPLVDAFLWIKRPGESDGACNGGPPSGQFWLAYALSLIANR